MKIFFTSSTQHLNKNISNVGKYISKKFCDDEIYIKINEEVKNQEIGIITCTKAPAENIIELCLLLDALQRNGAKINLLFTYFAYERQDRIIEKGEALSAQVISNIIKLFDIKKIFIFHPHSENLSNYLNFIPILPDKFYSPIVKNADMIIAPDKGATDLCKKIATLANKDFGWIEKKRPEHEKTEIIQLHGDVTNKKIIIIDDMITTGNTILIAANYLLSKNTKSIEIIASHGLFCNDAISKLENSKIEKIHISNSIKQSNLPNKFNIIDISNFIIENLT